MDIALASLQSSGVAGFNDTLHSSVSSSTTLFGILGELPSGSHLISLLAPLPLFHILHL